MNLQPVTLRGNGPLCFLCCACGGRATQTESRPVYADLDGRPFIDYYCHECATMSDARPLVWAELWSAMKARPDAWMLTTAAMFDEMLNVLPPADMGAGGFLVGEANHHNERGESVHACFIRRRTAPDSYAARYMTRREFNAWKVTKGTGQ